MHKKKVKRHKRSPVRIKQGESFTITAKSTGPGSKLYPRITVGFNTGPEMYKRLMDLAKRQGHKGIKVEKISKSAGGYSHYSRLMD